MRSKTADMAPEDAKVLDDVDEYGVHIVHVPEDDVGPGFSFTVGLWATWQQAEVVVFGLPQEVAQDLLNGLADEVDDGRRFAAGEKHDGVLVGYPVRFLELAKARYGEFLGVAQWAYEGEDFPALQLVWPDKQGRWPWDPGVREGFAEAQPIVGVRPSS
ncbi:MAG: DUF4262 domain-containing protein [Planctomycetes bacterium]|nr:DUF4262 domain-containing protein [Planctomycetota bacterium]